MIVVPESTSALTENLPSGFGSARLTFGAGQCTSQSPDLIDQLADHLGPHRLLAAEPVGLVERGQPLICDPRRPSHETNLCSNRAARQPALGEPGGGRQDTTARDARLTGMAGGWLADGSEAWLRAAMAACAPHLADLPVRINARDAQVRGRLVPPPRTRCRTTAQSRKSDRAGLP